MPVVRPRPFYTYYTAKIQIKMFFAQFLPFNVIFFA